METSLINLFKIKLSRNPHLKEILKGSANTLVLKVSGMLLALGVILLISKTYGAEGVGLYNLSIKTIAILGLISTVGLYSAILRYAGQFNNNESKHKLKLLYKHSIQITLPVSIFVGLLLFFSSDLIASHIFHNIKYKNSLRIFSLLLPFWAILNINVQYIRGLKYIKTSESLRSVTRPIINIILIIIFGTFIHNELLPIYTVFVAVVISTIISIFFIYKIIQNIQIQSTKEFSKNELLKTSLPMLVISVVVFLQTNLSIYFLEMYTTTDQVGIFTVCLRLATLINLVLIAVNTISAPKFSELYWSNKHSELQNVIFHSSKLMFVFSLVLGVTLIAFSGYILKVFGNDFIQGQIPLFILIIGFIISSISGSIGVLLNMTGHQNFFRNIVLLIFPINIFLNIILVPLYGTVGAAITNMISLALINILPVLYCFQKLNLVTFYIPYISHRIILHKS